MVHFTHEDGRERFVLSAPARFGPSPHPSKSYQKTKSFLQIGLTFFFTIAPTLTRNILIDCGKSFYDSARQWFPVHNLRCIDALVMKQPVLLSHTIATENMIGI